MGAVPVRGPGVGCRLMFGRGGWGLGAQEVLDAAGEVAFEAADRFPFGLAFGCLAR